MIEAVKWVLFRDRGAPVVFECRRCGTAVEQGETECPSCGSAEIARFEIQ